MEKIGFYILRQKVWLVAREILLCLFVSLAITLAAAIITGLVLHSFLKENGLRMYHLHLAIFVWFVIFFIEFFMFYKKAIKDKKRDFYFDQNIKIENKILNIKNKQEKLEEKIKRFAILKKDLIITGNRVKDFNKLQQWEMTEF